MNIDEYEREARPLYAELAQVVGAILAAAIGVQGGYRLQQVKDRAKKPASLRIKLAQRGIAATATLENDIKDLAGCRLVFYTNGDVSRFISSDIMRENFEVVEVKLHHPGREVEDAAQLYISNHYVVKLRPERCALPEYARFAGMRCEVQVQTILNHAWAEMAHDTIYKTPALGDFGGKAFVGIKNRLRKVAEKYLRPAGHEFQKIAIDFQRLVDGKALFDGDALDAILNAENNNLRAEALETFSENVLPLYDDLPAVYPEIVESLVAAGERARTTEPLAIETPFGELPAKTSGDVIQGISAILDRYWYHGVEITFDALLRLFVGARTEEERSALVRLGESMAKHRLSIWRRYGPAVQATLVERITALKDEERQTLAPLLTPVLRQILGTEVSGTTGTSSAITLQRGAVKASEAMRDVRTKAIALLRRQFALAANDEGRTAVLAALQSGTHPPISVDYDNALAQMLIDDARAVIEFEIEIAPSLSFELLQSVEDRVLRRHRMYSTLPKDMQDDDALVEARDRLLAAAIEFRNVANANEDFVIYKVLVGFNSVFPPAWEDPSFSFREAGVYRAEEVDRLLASINDQNAEIWLARIDRCAQTRSQDAATFPVFGDFLRRLAQSQPAFVFGYIDRLSPSLANFLPAMLRGLMASTEQARTRAEIEKWLAAGQHIIAIAWYLRSADPFDEVLLRTTLDSATKHADALAVRAAMLAAADQFEARPGTLVDAVFIPAIRYLAAVRDLSWVNMQWVSWYESAIIRALDETQAGIVLDALLPFPDLEDSAEHIAGAAAERWPARVVAFLGERQVFASTEEAPERYDAIPFEVHQLKAPLSAAPDAIVAGARVWFDRAPDDFKYDGGKLLASVFPDLQHGLEERLATTLAQAGEGDKEYVIAVLSAFEGRPSIYGLIRTIVAGLTPESPLLADVQSALDEFLGVVAGAFGFAELHQSRKALMESWLSDASDNVRAFAQNRIDRLDRWIAAENRSAEADIALRKLAYGEELDDGDEGDDAG